MRGCIITRSRIWQGSVALRDSCRNLFLVVETAFYLGLHSMFVRKAEVNFERRTNA
jgi:hypothetical protein